MTNVPPQGPPPPPWPPRKSQFGLIVGIVLGVLGLVCVTGVVILVVANDTFSRGRRTTIEVSVTGDGTAHIAYIEGTAATEPLPWSYSVTLFPDEQFWVTAAPVRIGGTATCVLTVGGRVVSTDTTTSTVNPARCETTA